MKLTVFGNSSHKCEKTRELLISLAREYGYEVSMPKCIGLGGKHSAIEATVTTPDKTPESQMREFGAKLKKIFNRK